MTCGSATARQYAEVSYVCRSMTASERSNIIKIWNKDPTISVMLLTMRASGIGLELTTADCAILMEHHVDPSQDFQVRLLEQS